MREMKKGIRKGFTLAEVLITLGIIGVVAALTIPTLMANYQKMQYVAGLKKAYAEVNEAIKLMANDGGCPDDLSCAWSSAATGTSTLGNAFKKYFKLSKDCGSFNSPGDESSKCFSESISWNIDGSGGRSGVHDWSFYHFITADGFGIALGGDSLLCDSNQDFSGATNPHLDNLSSVCGEIYIDVNGLKGPNNLGRDIFGFFIANGKGPVLYPLGGADMRDNTWRHSCGDMPGSLSGDRCAGRIMEEGWQMKY